MRSLEMMFYLGEMRRVHYARIALARDGCVQTRRGMESGSRFRGDWRLRGLRSGDLALVALCVAASVNAALADDSSATEQVVVTAAARGNAHAISLGEVDLAGTLTVADTLNENVASAYLSDTESNPFQPDLFYRGFDASPVLGTAEGLAVYQNGDRINEAFGDTVLWDVVPLFAVARIAVLPGSDPILGLNALGGAVSMDMKTGFDSQGNQADFSAGSFGRAKLIAQTTQQWGNDALYAGATAVHDDGWRRDSPSNLAQAYGDFSVRGSVGSAGLSLSLTSDKLSENAAVPVQNDPKAAFAIPDTADDRVIFLQGRGEYDLYPGLTLRGDTFVRATDVETLNGQPSGFAPCGGNPAQLCNDDSPLVTLGGTMVPASAIGNGTLGVQTTDTLEWGATAQLEWAGKLFMLNDTAIFGTTFDDAPTDFNSSTMLGVLSFQPGGVTTVIGDSIALSGVDWNTRLRTVNTDVGVFAENTLQFSPTLSLSLAARWNHDRIDITDRYGVALTGNHAYSGFNPSADFSWKVGNAATLHIGVGQSSRTPTAAELSCANGAQPCLFPLSFISDPDLHQVVAQTADLGANGNAALGELSIEWVTDFYDTRNSNDILFVSSGPFIGSGYFSNVGVTDRRGVEAGMHVGWRTLDASVNFGFVNAAFQSGFTELSAFNPGADPDGNIIVRAGDRIPNIPRDTAKLSLGWFAMPRLRFEIKMIAASGQFLRGDEANLQTQLPGYAVFNAEVAYSLSDVVTLSLEGENIFDKRYATFGLYGDPTAKGIFPQFDNPRFIVPAQPFGVWAAIRAAL